MNTLAPSAGPARRSGGSDGLRPPAPTQAAVPPEFASLTWPADMAAVELPAPAAPVPDHPFPPPTPQWKAPTCADSATSATGTTRMSVAGPSAPPPGTGWSWTPIMGDDVPAPSSLRPPTGDPSIGPGAVEAEHAATEPGAAAGVAMPSVSFEPAAGTIMTEITEADRAAVTAVVTATVPAFVTYAPQSDYVLPGAPAREPTVVEVRESVVSVPRTPPARTRRSGRTGALLLVVVAAISAAAYLGLRAYIYGDAVVADDGTRVVEVEPTRTIVVVDAP